MKMAAKIRIKCSHCGEVSNVHSRHIRWAGPTQFLKFVTMNIGGNK